MNTQLFIPKRIKVGFNPRPDTYTGRLGYIIAQDGKKWRKETSWLSWIYNYMSPETFEPLKRKEYDQRIKQYKQNKYTDKQIQDYLGSYENYNPRFGKVSSDPEIAPVEYDNVPVEGFVLNKKVGGYKSDWNIRQAKARVFDPRGFEFEISFENLLFILQETNSIKGKGLEGEFIFSWDGKDLVLLPAGCSDYQKSVVFTDLQKEKVSTKELVPGGIYETKRQEKLVYLGKFNCYGRLNYSYHSSIKASNDFVFANKDGNLVNLSSIGTIAKVVDKNPVSNFAELIDKTAQDDMCGKISGLKEKSVKIGFFENLQNDNGYNRHNYYGNTMEGEDYISYRNRGNDSLIDNMFVTLYKKVAENTYQIFHISRIKEEVEKKGVVAFKDGTLEDAKKYYKENYFCWKHKGYKLTSTKTISYENGEIKIKNTDFDSNNIYSKKEIEAMGFVGLEGVVKSGKKYELA